MIPMMAPARLILEPPARNDGSVRYAAFIEEPDGDRHHHLWWDVPEEWNHAVTPMADPFVVSLIFPIMQKNRPVHVEGCVAPSLLANLEQYSRVWAIWKKGKYHPATLTAEREQELPPVADPGLAITGCSCGLDSSYTLYRHARGLVGKRSRRVGATLLQYGFDVRLKQEQSEKVFSSLLASAQEISGSLNVPCIPVKTNFRELDIRWSDTYAAQLAGGLMLMAGRFDSGLVANDLTYYDIGTIYGSHPVINWMLGSRGFQIIDDGGEVTRSEKIHLVSGWPEAMRNLRVCFGVDCPGTTDNCCRCEKCIRTILAFRIAGCPRPSSLPHDITCDQIRKIRMHYFGKWNELVKDTDAAGLGSTDWGRAIHDVVRWNRWRMFRSKCQRPFLPLRNAFRRIFRGSPLSSRQKAAD